MTTVLLLISTVISLCFAVILLSYSVVWYENANRAPQIIQNRFSSRSLLLMMRLFLTELMALFFTLALHPFGWLDLKTKPNTSGRPVILLHGLFHNQACWLWTKFRLQQQGFVNLHTINLPPWKDVESLTERLAKKVDELRLSQGVENVDLVGHSMGGIIARNYIQLRGGARKVHHCILLGAPNAGSKLAPFALTPLGLLLMPGSEFMKRLQSAPLPEEVEITSIYSCHDNLVLPADSAHLIGAENIELSGIGHDSLLYHNQAHNAIIQALKGPANADT